MKTIVVKMSDKVFAELRTHMTFSCSTIRWLAGEARAAPDAIELMESQQCPCKGDCLDVVNANTELRKLVLELKTWLIAADLCLDEVDQQGYTMPDLLLPRPTNKLRRRAEAALKGASDG